MNVRSVVTAVGVLAVGWGLAVVFAPGLATLFPLPDLFVKFVGLLAFVQGLRVVQSRRHTDIDGTDTGDPETNVTLPIPGQEFDERLRSVHSGPRKRRFRSRKELRERLESALVEAIVQREGCSDDGARTRIETGEWTDDPEAAAFVAGQPAPRRSWREWLRQSFGSETAFQHRARRSARAVARYVEEGR
ncbi:hypothetical protein V5735_06520 (plasmid) [Haladaptatus sp. SPP-AMP-3]|uniref:DUF7269 family protein n=1 Tax=Haladaptatus sp. SPP-AMP-3 TaxID=3121295 RepID=UPI003C306D9D